MPDGICDACRGLLASDPCSKGCKAYLNRRVCCSIRANLFVEYVNGEHHGARLARFAQGSLAPSTILSRTSYRDLDGRDNIQ